MLLLALVVLPLLVQSHTVSEVLPLDCEDIYNEGSNHSGVYTIYPAGKEKPVQVYCEMPCEETHKDYTWTVIQRRIDGSVSFYRPWEQYKNGFGNLSGEYWLGLETLFLLTFREKYQLRVDMEDFEGGSAYAQYSEFSIDSEANNYRLHVSDYVNGGAGDCLSSNDGRDFATYDKDIGTCADTYGGGFWYYYYYYYYYYYWNGCSSGNPNGLYKIGNVRVAYSGVMWSCWRGYYYSLKTMVMKIRRYSLEDLKKN